MSACPRHVPAGESVDPPLPTYRPAPFDFDGPLAASFSFFVEVPGELARRHGFAGRHRQRHDGQSALMPAVFTTLPQYSTSRLSRLPSACGGR